MSQNTSKQISINSIHVNGEHDLSPLLRYYIAATLRIPIELGDTARSARFIDTRAKINVITLNLAKRIEFPIRDGSRFMNMVSQTNHFRRFYRVVEEIPVKIGSAVNTVPIWVVEEVDNELVLGIFYIHVSRMTQRVDSDGLTV